MYSSVGAVPPGSGWFVTVSLLSLWRLAPDSSLESARSASRFRRDWCEESRPLWPWSVAHLFIWDDKYFDQPLPQLAIDWEDSPAHAHFFLERTPARRRNTSIVRFVCLNLRTTLVFAINILIIITFANQSKESSLLFEITAGFRSSLARTASIKAGKIERKMIARTTNVKLRFTTGMLPNR